MRFDMLSNWSVVSVNRPSKKDPVEFNTRETREKVAERILSLVEW